MLARLTLTDFRSYAEALIEPGPGLVVLTGENGAGKTNILEAISLLAPGRGLRGAALSEMARQRGAGGFGVAARLSSIHPFVSSEVEKRVSTSLDTNGLNNSASIDLGTGTSPAAPERRLVRINGAPATANTLAEWVSILWLTPAMDRLFTEAASGRRRFLDRLALALEPAHAHHAARYEAAMRARNRLLAQEEAADPAWLGALEAQMAEHGLPLAEARARTVAALGQRIAAQAEGPFARAGLALEGWTPTPDFAADLRASRARDAAAGRTLEGPHRQDLRVTHLSKGQPADRCSTGEQKALLLGLILAHADLVAERAGRRPILLLDEVAAHLDPTRRAALFARLEASGGQVWMTGTEPALFEGLDAGASRFRVAEGRIGAS